MKVDNIKETAVKEVLKARPELSPKSGSPYMQKKQTKKEDTFSAELNKKQLTPEQMRLLKDQTHKQAENMMKDSITISYKENAPPTAGAANNSGGAPIGDAERAAIASTAVDYEQKRRYDSYARHAASDEKENHMSLSVFNLMFAACGLFLVITGFMYLPVGIIWIIIGVIMFMYAFVKK